MFSIQSIQWSCECVLKKIIATVAIYILLAPSAVNLISIVEKWSDSNTFDRFVLKRHSFVITALKTSCAKFHNDIKFSVFIVSPIESLTLCSFFHAKHHLNQNKAIEVNYKQIYIQFCFTQKPTNCVCLCGVRSRKYIRVCCVFKFFISFQTVS